jgi:hypothetical protein
VRAESITLTERQRFAVEAVYYVVLIVTVFRHLMGLSEHGAALTALAGLGTLVVYLFDGVPIPRAFKFILAINVFANLSLVLGQGETPLIGDGLSNLLHWGSFTLLVLYLCRDPKVETRMLLVTAAVIIAAVQIGGGAYSASTRYDRLYLEEVGGTFANSNQLAYMAGVFSVAMLFRSLRASLVYKVLFWTFAVLLAIIVIRTVSRGGALTFSFGICCFILAVFLTEGKRYAGLVAFIVVTIVASVLILHGGYDEQLSSLGDRAQENSYEARAHVFSSELLAELWGSILSGYGPQGAFVSGVGIKAHNAFIYTHMAFGGIAAYILTYWILSLGWRIKNLLFSNIVDVDKKLFGVAMFGMVLGCLLLTNSGYLLLSTIYATGICQSLGLRSHYSQLAAQRQ